MDTLWDILDCVEEDTDIAIFDKTTGKFTSNRPMTVEEAEDELSDMKFAFDSISVKKDILIINIESD